LAILRAAYGDEADSLNKASAEATESDLQKASEDVEAPVTESQDQAADSADTEDTALESVPENAITEEAAPVAVESRDLNQIKAAESEVESADDSATDSASESSGAAIEEDADSAESEAEDVSENIPEGLSQDAAPVTEDLNGLSNISRLLVCSGENFPDALAASATGLPILVVNSHALSNDQVSFLQTHTVSQVFVIGGTAVVTDNLVEQIRPYVTGSIERISGNTRYETSTAVARYFFGNNVARLAIAAGNNFPDALSAAQITSYLNMPLVLANHRSVTAGHAYIGSNLQEMYIFGGTAALSDWNIRQLLGQVPTGNAIEILGDNRSGGQTLKNLLQNALIPAGRTLYVYGGGWNDDASQIGYQKSWANFFNTYAYNNYNRKNFEYTSWNGVDCSGYIGWVVYNTKYTRSNQASILYGNGTSHTAVKLAKRVADLGYASYMGQRVNSFSQLRPGDMVSMSGHIWMCMGTCSDGSALIIHSSPMGQTYGGGVQLCGSPSSSGNTNSQSYQLAQKYNQYYFEYWPYPTLNVGSNYLSSSVGYCRWNNDPDGIRNMSAEQVMATILGPL
ncbi:MAG: cell wall-binding repeat-containing protein, partial [Lachnospiraceae bacterium]|nr:cell wall-binding repeat-containing protein [Candidatus Equihabitans merdae]